MEALIVEQQSDLELVELTRGGDRRAYGELWNRHAPAVRAAVRSFTNFEADDVVSEAFAKALQQIRAGKGPTEAVRAYLIRAAKNVAIDMSRSRGGLTSGLEENDIESVGLEDHSEAILDGLTVSLAFNALAPREREALWYRDVEDLSIQDCAKVLGVSPNAATVIVKRSRQKFSDAWVASNLELRIEVDPECAWVVAQLPKYSRRVASRSSAQRIEGHLPVCLDCAKSAEQAKRVRARLAFILIPGIAGLPAASYLGDERVGRIVESGYAARAFGPGASGVRAGIIAALIVVAVAGAGAFGAGAFLLRGVVPTGLIELQEDRARADIEPGSKGSGDPKTAGDEPGGSDPGSTETVASVQPPNAAVVQAPALPVVTPVSSIEPTWRALTAQQTNLVPSYAGPETFAGTAALSAEVSIAYQAVESGQWVTRTHTVTADADGAWSAELPERLRSGVSYVQFEQTYVDENGETVTDPAPLIVTPIQEGRLRFSFLPLNSTQTYFQVDLGIPGATLVLESPTGLPELNRSIVLDERGAIDRFLLDLTPEQVAAVRFWQVVGDDAGARKYWCYPRGATC